MLLRFEETNAIVEAPSTPDFLRTLCAGAFDWPAQEVAAGEPVSRVTVSGARYVLHSPDREPVVASALQAVCGLLVDVVDAVIAATPSRLCLHCAAVEFGGRLVIFPSQSHAGKSTLVARLAESGRTVLGDDILPISDDDRSGIALGIAPRLRLPLPDGASAAFRSFVADNEAASDGRYLYLDADCGALAPRGTTREIGAVVLLDRQDDVPAYFSQASESETLQTLIRQNVTSGARSVELIDRLQALVARLPRFKLTYSDVEDATALLDQTFRDWPVTTAGLPNASASFVSERSDGTRPGIASQAPFRQVTGIELRQVEGDLFLADAQGAAIYHLNAIGTGIWNLLAEPTSLDEAVEILTAAFPEIGGADIAKDAGALFSDLEAAGFIRPADQSSM